MFSWDQFFNKFSLEQKEAIATLGKEEFTKLYKEGESNLTGDENGLDDILNVLTGPILSAIKPITKNSDQD